MQSAETYRTTIENFLLPRTQLDLGPLEPMGDAARGRGRLGARAFELEVHPAQETCMLRVREGIPPKAETDSLVDAVFTRFTTASTVEVFTEGGFELRRRETFYQRPDLWHHRGDRYPLPLSYRQTGDIRHPVRSKPDDEVLYRRRCAGMEQTFSLRSFTFADHFELFCKWMNDPEVADFWEMAWEPARLRDHIQARMEDPHIIPMIGYFDADPFAYFEVYWSKEDRLGPHYDAHDYDRGFHMAVGDKRYRFRGIGRYWFLSMAHYLFLDDPRTMSLVGEPRVDQTRVRNWSKTTPWQLVKEFDFPHKRAMLMMLPRDRFFGSFQL